MGAKLTSGAGRFGGLFGRVRWSDGRPAGYRHDRVALTLNRVSLALLVVPWVIWALSDSLLAWTFALAPSFAVGMAAQWRLHRVVRALEQAGAVPERTNERNSVMGRFYERYASKCEARAQRHLKRAEQVSQGNDHYRSKRIKIMKHEHKASKFRKHAQQCRELGEHFG